MIFEEEIFNDVVREAKEERIEISEENFSDYNYRIRISIKHSISIAYGFDSEAEAFLDDVKNHLKSMTIVKLLKYVIDVFFPMHSELYAENITTSGYYIKLMIVADICELFSTAKSIESFFKFFKCIIKKTNYEFSVESVQFTNFLKSRNDILQTIYEFSSIDIHDLNTENKNLYPFDKIAKASKFLLKDDVDWFKSIERLDKCDFWKALLYSNKAVNIDSKSKNSISDIHPWLKEEFSRAVLENPGRWNNEAKIVFCDVCDFRSYHSATRLSSRTCEDFDYGRPVLEWFITPAAIFGYLGIMRDSKSPKANAYAEMLFINSLDVEEDTYETKSTEQILLENLALCTSIKVPKSLMDARMLFDVREQKITERNEKIKEINGILRELFSNS